MNSSPPYRPSVSVERRFELRVAATPRRTTSPAPWPYVSLTALKWSMSTNATARGRS